MEFTFLNGTSVLPFPRPRGNQEKGCSGVPEEGMKLCGTLLPNQDMNTALFGLSIEVLLRLGPSSFHHGRGRG